MSDPVTTAELAEITVQVAKRACQARRELDEMRLLHAAERDYLAWLQREVCKARDWTIIDVIKAWHQELDRREHGRATVRGEQVAA